VESGPVMAHLIPRIPPVTGVPEYKVGVAVALGVSQI